MRQLYLLCGACGMQYGQGNAFIRQGSGREGCHVQCWCYRDCKLVNTPNCPQQTKVQQCSVGTVIAFCNFRGPGLGWGLGEEYYATLTAVVSREPLEAEALARLIASPSNRSYKQKRTYNGSV